MNIFNFRNNCQNIEIFFNTNLLTVLVMVTKGCDESKEKPAEMKSNENQSDRWYLATIISLDL